MICASFLALARRNGLPASPKFRQLLPRAEELCHYLGCLENGQDCGPELPGDAGVGLGVGLGLGLGLGSGLGLGLAKPNPNPDPNPNPNPNQVGTFGGSEDHTAIMCCSAGHLSQYAFCPTRLEATLAFP